MFKKNPSRLGRDCPSLGQPIFRNNKGPNWEHAIDAQTNQSRARLSSKSTHPGRHILCLNHPRAKPHWNCSNQHS